MYVISAGGIIHILITILSSYYNFEGRIHFSRELHAKIVALNTEIINFSYGEDPPKAMCGELIAEITLLTSHSFSMLYSTGSRQTNRKLDHVVLNV